MQLIVFTDLDGTLLDANTYSYAVSRPGLRRLQQANVPVVFCSAKTRTEQLPLREELDVNQPFIVENGSAIFVPSNSGLPLTNDFSIQENDLRAAVLGLPLLEIYERLDAVRDETGVPFRGFTEMPVEQVMELTGLDLTGAERARTRDFSDTIVIPENTDAAPVIAACRAHGLKCPDGGRFLTVTGNGADKGQAVTLLTDIYRQHYGEIITIGIGDSPNDAPMLAAVDRPFLVQRPDHIWRTLNVDVPNLIRLEAVGPAAFAAMVDDLL